MRIKNSKKIKSPLIEPLVVWSIPYPILAVVLTAWSALILWLSTNQIAVRVNMVFGILDQWSLMHALNPYLLQGFAGFFTAAWILWVCVEIGQWLLDHWFGNSSLIRLERMVFGGGIGIAMLSNVVLLLGAARLWYSAVFYGLLGILSLIALVRPKTPMSAFAVLPKREGRAPWKGAWIIVLALIGGLFFLGALTPETFFDSLHYHLAIPNLYRLEHRIFAIPSTMFANYVMALHMLYGLGITIGNTHTAKFLHLGLAVLLGASMIGFGRRHLSAGAGLLSIVIFLGMPMVGMSVVTAGIDTGWSALQFLAAWALIRALQESKSLSADEASSISAAHGRRWLWIAGGLTGFSASCKYLGFPYLPIACLLIVWQQRFEERQSWKITLSNLMHFTLMASLFVFPQLIKNYILNGNPIYPFLGTHWGVPRIDPRDWNIYYVDQGSRDLKTTFASASSILAFILQPWHLTLDANSSVGLVGPIGLMAFPALFFMRTQSQAIRTLRRYAALAWFVWMLTTVLPRYAMPVLVMASPLFAEALVMACQSAWVRFALMGGVLCGTLYNVAALTGFLHQMEGWTVVGGLVPERTYLGQSHALYPTPPYEGIVWMNEHLPADAKILFIGDSRTYYSTRRTVPSSTPGWQQIVKEVQASRDGDALARRLRAQGVTHLFLNMGETVRTEQYKFFPWDAAGWLTFSNFWSRYVRLVWKTENVEHTNNFKLLYVYELLSDEEALRPHEIPPCPFVRWAPNGTVQKIN